MANLSVYLPLLLLLLFREVFLHTPAAAYSIGVNYGTVADNLPAPSDVARFLKDRTTIDKIKIFDANPDILRAFANTNISVTVTVANDHIIDLATPANAETWVKNNILPFYPQTAINRIAVGNEVVATHDKVLIVKTLSAMKALHKALEQAGISKNVHVSTPHSLGILSANSEPPSISRFRKGYDRAVFAPMLDFHRLTKSPFMINPYPYFGFNEKTLNYALFRPNGGVWDEATGKNYTNMLDAQLDAVYSAMKKLGYGDVDIVVAETGWPSAGDPDQPGVSLENAKSYNSNLVKRVMLGTGTPLMPNRTFDTYIFSLFNEDLKLTTSEKNFGLFRPDFTSVYDVGILRDEAGDPTSSSPAIANHSKAWCVPKKHVPDEKLQANLDYACGSGTIDCGPIRADGPCFVPDTLRSHASYAMNEYYQHSYASASSCDFGGTGMTTKTDPTTTSSNGACKYISGGSGERNIRGDGW